MLIEVTQLVAKRDPGDSQRSSGLGQIAVCLAHHGSQQLPFNTFDDRAVRTSRRFCDYSFKQLLQAGLVFRVWLRSSHVSWQKVRQQNWSRAAEECLTDHAFEFANVAWPRIVVKDNECFGRDTCYFALQFLSETA